MQRAQSKIVAFRTSFLRRVGVRLLAAALLVVLPAALGFSASDELPDPVPIQRVLLVKPAQLANEMQRVEKGILVQLPLTEFEERVHKAAKAQAPKPAPRLIESRYRAAPIDNGGLGGTGQWKIIHPGTGPALLPLQPCNLAVRQPRFENREALVADFDGKTPALLVEDTGEHSVAIEWSARAEQRPDGLYFALELPAAPVTGLELDLPADREPSVGGGAVLSGPFPSETPDRRLWKIACGGRPGVNLWIRRAQSAASSGPALFVRQHTVQTLLPEGLNGTYRFDLEITRPGVRRLVCELDRDLRPAEITVANLEKSDFQTGTAGAPSRLVLTLREPLPVGQETLQIRCLAPLGAPAPAPREGRTVNWTSPALRLVEVGFGADHDEVDVAARVVPRGETLEIRCHPEVRVENWEPNGFRLTDAAPRGDSDQGTAFRVLTLQGGGIEPEGKGPRRPAARLRAGGGDFRARQTAWWQIADSRMTLTLQISYDVTRGQLFQLPVQLPADWEIESVELNPGTLLRNWSVSTENNRSTLLVDLQKPLTPGDDLRRDRAGLGESLHGLTLTVRLNSARQEALAGRPLPFPDAVPLGARLREGALAIDYAESLYEGTVMTPLAESNVGDDGAAWVPQTPDHYFAYRGQAPQGTLLLRPRAPRLRAICSTDVYPAADRVDTRIVLEAEVGSVEVVDVYLSAAGADPARWRVEPDTNQLRQVERVFAPQAAAAAALTAAHGMPDALAVLARLGCGEHWRLRFTRPLRGHSPVVLHASQSLAPSNGRWDARLPMVLNAERMDGEVTVHLAGANHLALETAGLRELVAAYPAPAHTKAGAPRRTFRYGATPALMLRGPLPPRVANAASIGYADLETFVHRDGGVEHRLTFDLAGWPEPTLPLPLPPGCHPVAVGLDGHALQRPPATESADGQTVLHLPVPAGADGADGGHRFEIVYACDGRPWSLWTRAEAPRPQLPVEPLLYRHTWRLPPGASPLDESNFRRLPGPGEGFEPSDPRRWTPRERALVRVAWWPAPTREADAAQRQALADAVQALRRRDGGHTLALADVAEGVALNLAKDGRALVLDTGALRAAGLTPRTPLAVAVLSSAEDQAPPWDGLGLVAVPARSALLLTTDRQLSRWREAAPAAPVSDAVTRAVVDAAEGGQDASGRFRSALAGGWLADAPSADDRAETFADWTAWEQLPGAGPDTSLVVVRGETASRTGLSLSLVIGLGLGVVLGLFGWQVRGWGRWRLLPLLGWLALAGLGVLVLPSALQYLAWGPLLAGGVVLLVWYVVASVVRRPLPVQPARGTVAAVAIGCLLLVVGLNGPSGRAAPVPPGFTVFVVPGPAEAPDKQAVLAPPELLEQLQALARPPLGSSAANLLSADYVGKLVEGVAEFDANFAVQCLSDEPTTLALPLDGVQLHGEVWLDGAQAHPVALVAPQTGFALKVRGQGRHKVEMHFRVPVTGTGGDRDVQFTAPRLLQNRLRLKLPGDAAYVQALSKYGAKRLTTGEDAKLLDVDLGHVATVHLYWFQEAEAKRPAKVQFREAYLWDLRPDAPTLTALLHYDIADGPVTTLAVQLPHELEVRGAEARRAAAATGPTGVVRLSDWKVHTGAGLRTLVLRFANPVRGDVQVQLDLVPATPLPATVALPLPAPQGTPHRDGGYLAYRVQGLEATRTDWLRVKGVGAAAFAPFWPAASRPDPAALAGSYTFNREGDQGPVLKLHLRPQTVVRATQEIAVRVGPQQARVQATLELTAPNKDLAMVEWEVQSPQAFTVVSVTGAEVHCWTQTGNRVQVWLDRSTDKARLELSGWLPLVADGKRMRLDLPALRVVSAQAQETTVRLNTSSGLGFTQAQPRNLAPAPDTTPGEQELVYHTDRADYGGAFVVQPATTGPDVQVLTLVDVREGRLAFTATLDFHPRNSELRTINVRLSDWEGDEVRLDAPRAARRRESSHTADGRTWSLELQTGATVTFGPAWALAAGPTARLVTRPGVTGPYRCTLSGSVPLADIAGGLRVPRVTVLGAGRADYFLALAGKDLSADGVAGLTPLANPAQALRAWKDESARLAKEGGFAWKVPQPGDARTAPDWKLRLVPRASPGEQGPVVVFLSEQTAMIADQKRWLHEATYTFRHEAGAELTLTLPDGARLVSAALDGAPMPQLLADAPRLTLPLPGRGGVRRLHLRWVYDEGREALTAPNLERPRLDGARDGPVLYTVLAPAGFTAPGATELQGGLPRAAALHLAAATADLADSLLMAEQKASAGSLDGAPLAEAQKRFAENCRRAERALDAAGDKGDPTKKGLADQLQALRKANEDQARRLGYDALRKDAERNAVAAALSWPSDVGLPLYVVAADGAVPHVSFEATRDREGSRMRLATVAWLTLLALVGLSACFRGLVAAARLFWPEQVALVGVAAWLAAGPTLPALVLIAVGVVARAAYVVGAMRGLRTRPPAHAAKNSPGGSSNRSGT